jgi:hypothetical protein
MPPVFSLLVCFPDGLMLCPGLVSNCNTPNLLSSWDHKRESPRLAPSFIFLWYWRVCTLRHSTSPFMSWVFLR